MPINEHEPPEYLYVDVAELKATDTIEINHSIETPLQNPERACGHKLHKKEQFCRECGWPKKPQWAEKLGEYDGVIYKLKACSHNIKRAQILLEKTDDSRNQNKQKERIQYWSKRQKSLGKTCRELAEYLAQAQSQTNEGNDV